MFQTIFNWIFYVLKEIQKIGEWLITPQTIGVLQSQENDLSTNGVILDSQTASIKIYNFFVRLFTGNWDFQSPPPPISITPIYVIGVTFITAIFIALFVKVWIRR